MYLSASGALVGVDVGRFRLDGALKVVDDRNESFQQRHLGDDDRLGLPLRHGWLERRQCRQRPFIGLAGDEKLHVGRLGRGAGGQHQAQRRDPSFR